ncbi:restriction endonuclease subunit S [Idiomarina sp. OT37-5b]|uniref:restriction endonuclease subunit S n=1 Tax=Idiomarina sp. OT37-5b TaxID=2100422 RepID=UPI000CFA7818|nr:restriction endonuclease subunit S [Idiomarina sp. OT37-5b]AVJ57058.1 restriction endonuclease subunit S [Idiomarina sp. OT37-5b]
MSCRSFPTHWQLLPLADALDALIDYRGKTPKKTDTGIPLITAKIVKNGKILPVSEFIAEEDYDEWMVRGLPQVGDVVVTTEAPLGEVAQLEDCNVALAQRIVTLRGAKEILESDYLRYVMQGPYVQGQLEARASGSTVKGIKQSELRKILLPIPPKQEQTKIAKILKSIDNKIRINEQASQTLEQIAQAIFKSWFVDFAPVKAKINALEAGGSDEDALLAAMQAISGKDKAQLTRLQTDSPEHYNQLRTTAELFPSAMQDSELGDIPEGWDINCIKDVAEVVKGKSYKSAELAPSNTALVTLKSFNRGGGYRLDGLKPYTGKYKPQQEVQVGDLIIAYTDVTQAADVIGKPAMVVGDDNYSSLVVSLDVAVVRPKLQPLKPFLYGLTRSKSFQSKMQSHTTGTTVLHLAKNAVPEFEFALPSQDLIAIYESQVKPIFNLVNENIQENRNLERIRDTLLPKLLSGEIDIDENG